MSDNDTPTPLKRDLENTKQVLILLVQYLYKELGGDTVEFLCANLSPDFENVGSEIARKKGIGCPTMSDNDTPLTDEVAAHDGNWDTKFFRMKHHAEWLERQLAEARRDKERLDWMEVYGNASHEDGCAIGQPYKGDDWFLFFDGPGRDKSGATLRAAIDAAMEDAE